MTARILIKYTFSERSMSDEHIAQEAAEQRGIGEDPLDILLMLEESERLDHTDERMVKTLRRHGIIIIQ